MAGNVRQRLLHDPVGGRFHLRLKSSGHPLMFEIDQYLCLPRVTLEERQQGGNQSELVQRGRPQVERQSPYPLQEFADDNPHLFERRLGRLRRQVRLRFQ